MKKRLFYILFLTNLLFAESNSTKKVSELELFLFKIGFESLLNDVDRQKKDVQLNKEDITLLKERVEVLFDDYKKKKFANEFKNSIVIKDEPTKESLQRDEEIEKLKSQVLELSNLVKELKRVKSVEPVKAVTSLDSLVKEEYISNKKGYTFATVFRDTLNVKGAPFTEAQVVNTLKKGDIIKIEGCNKYDWCKIYKEEGYVGKHLLLINK